MSRQLSRWTADTDGRCCNCGAHLSQHDLADGLASTLAGVYASARANGYDFLLCGMCRKLEEALIHQSGSRYHPERLTHYEKTQEKYS